MAAEATWTWCLRHTVVAEGPAAGDTDQVLRATGTADAWHASSGWAGADDTPAAAAAGAAGDA